MDTAEVKEQVEGSPAVAQADGRQRVVAEVNEVLRNNAIDASRPLSAASYSAWRRKAQTEAALIPSFTSNGYFAFSITSTAKTPLAAGSLLETQLTIRTSDWHAITGHLRVKSSDGVEEFDLTETAFVVLPFKSLPPTVFESTDNSTQPRLPVTENSEPANTGMVLSPRFPAPQALHDSHPDAVAAAIDVQYELHKLKACTEEQLTVDLSASGEVIVHGTVYGGERWRQISEGLLGLKIVPRAEVTILAASDMPSVHSALSLRTLPGHQLF
jgi:hypothetical protein